MTGETKELLIQYLTKRTFSYNGIERYSTLNAGLRECRLMTKRNNEGVYDGEISFGYAGHWLGAIGYFTILDQIGSFLKLKGEENKGATNNIEMAIRRFGFEFINKEEAKLDALIALRNCFTHDFNLLNNPTNEKKIPSQQHKFQVNTDISKPNNVIELPQVYWDGNIPNKDFYRIDDTTVVNLFAFGNMVENIVKKIEDFLKEDKVELGNDIQYLINKYTFVTSEHYVKN